MAFARSAFARTAFAGGDPRTVGAAPPTFSNGYAYRKALTIDHTKVSGGTDLANFPLLVCHTDPALAHVWYGGKVQSLQGLDLRFEAADGTKLDYELEAWNPATGQFVAWVRVPVLSASVNTVLYCYYGNGSVAAPETNTPSVWDSHFGAVYHMGDGFSAGAITDSTANGRTLGYTTALTGAYGYGYASVLSQPGKIGNALYFKKSDQYRGYVAVSSGANTAGVGAGLTTVASWVCLPTISAANYDGPTQGLIAIDAAAYPNNADTITIDLSTGKLQATLGGDGDGTVFSTAVLTPGVWYHVALVRDTNLVRLYINGVQDFAVAYPGSATNSQPDEPLKLGGAGRALDVIYDHTALSNVARSAGWLGTEYASQSSPTTFYGLGVEEAGTTGGTGPADVSGTGAVAAGASASGAAIEAETATGTVSDGATDTGTGTVAETAAGAVTGGAGDAGTGTVAIAGTGSSGGGASTSGTGGIVSGPTGGVSGGASDSGTATEAETAGGAANAGASDTGTGTVGGTTATSGATQGGASDSGTARVSETAAGGSVGDGASASGSAIIGTYVSGSAGAGAGTAGAASEATNGTGDVSGAGSDAGSGTEAILAQSGTVGGGGSVGGAAFSGDLGKLTPILTLVPLYTGTLTLRRPFCPVLTLET